MGEGLCVCVCGGTLPEELDDHRARSGDFQHCTTTAALTANRKYSPLLQLSRLRWQFILQKVKYIK